MAEIIRKTSTPNKFNYKLQSHAKVCDENEKWLPVIFFNQKDTLWVVIVDDPRSGSGQSL